MVENQQESVEKSMVGMNEFSNQLTVTKKKIEKKANSKSDCTLMTTISFKSNGTLVGTPLSILNFKSSGTPMCTPMTTTPSESNRKPMGTLIGTHHFKSREALISTPKEAR